MVRSSCSNISFTLLHLIAVFALTSRCSCSKADSLSANQSLHDGETLISANKTFELGFFSPVNSANRFVGIWFYGIANGTVVWVGNRNSPLVDTSGSLVINYDGDLIVVDGKGSSSTLAHGSGMRDLKATILDSGNFVLSERGNSSNILWQSFDDPTDTWLPGMKLGFFGQQNRLLTSWTSSDDPSPGDFSFGVDLRSGEELFIWGKEKVYWTSGKYIGNPSFTISSVSFEFVYRNKIEIYFTYTYDVEDVPSMFVIDSMGQIQCLTWIKDDQGWVLFWARPRFYCDVYNACGSFGVCDSLVFPFCSCLTGFIPESPTDWKNLSCTRMASLQCGSGGEIDKFVETSNMVFPLNPQVFDVGRAEECESACLNDCNCTAYVISTNCNLWYGELMNLKVLNPSDYNDSNVANSTIYIRVAASELESAGDKRKKRKILIVGITTTLSFLICCSLFCLMWTRRCRNRGIKKSYGQQSVITFSTTEAINLWETEERESQFSMFDFSRIANATNNFSAENKLGEGGFGPVYKGLLPEGQDIAVKRLAAYSGQGLVEFKNEILLVAKLQHRNLVRLLGCCTQGEEKILVYEYMPNKSLDFFLFDKTGRTRLDWIKRFNIIDGIAQGLLYLHKHSRQRIIHRDLKASNILLDEEMNPKISDFGMARIFGSKETQANTNRVVGTYGYMSPEYAMEGLFSVKSDVFSFGVLLLEIVSGLRNAGFHQKGNSLNLLGHAWELWKEGRWIELVDGSLGEGCPEEVLRCIHVALMCVQENAVDRPTMSEVIAMLSSENASLPDPKQPPFITVRISAATNTDGACSPNVVTVSVPEGR